MTKYIVNLYYTAMMTFLVFTFAEKLLFGLIQKPTLELVLCVLLWLTLVAHVTFAYIRILTIKQKRYTTVVLISDCIDVLCIVYMCAAMGLAYNQDGPNTFHTYIHLSIPFIIIATNQFWWFFMVREFDIPAIFRISILFFGMLTISVSELINHSFWNLFAVSFLIVLLGILRAINKAPGKFGDIITKIWYDVKRRWFSQLIK